MRWEDVVYDEVPSMTEVQRNKIKKRDMAQKVAAILSENEATLVDIDDIFLQQSFICLSRFVKLTAKPCAHRIARYVSAFIIPRWEVIFHVPKRNQCHPEGADS